MTEKRCLDCYDFYAPTSMCYRDPKGPIPIEDPLVHSADCPQDREKDYPGIYSGKFPYCEKLCKGCRADLDNTALPNESCQGFKVRPQSEADGQCPYHDTRASFGKKYGIKGRYDGMITTDVAARLILRGVNDHNFAYWDCDSCSNSYGLESAPCQGFYMRYGGYHGKKGDVEFGSWRGESYIIVNVDHAKMDNKHLVLWYGSEHDFDAKVRISIPIIPIEKWGEKVKTEQADDWEGEDCEECEAVQTVQKKPANVSSLEAWL